MPITKKFLITAPEVKKIGYTIRHKLRTVLLCYCVKDLVINKEEKTFSFRKVHKIRGVKMEGKETLTGYYTISEIDIFHYRIDIFVNDLKND